MQNFCTQLLMVKTKFKKYHARHECSQPQAMYSINRSKLYYDTTDTDNINTDPIHNYILYGATCKLE